ncbi:MAG: hypothetical protein M1813_002798 [Trichoglossum hirsutum]|nr:MAG: hypothetical protein M1813_002798 [Trichoglossum hirsutum]
MARTSDIICIFFNIKFEDSCQETGQVYTADTLPDTPLDNPLNTPLDTPPDTPPAYKVTEERTKERTSDIFIFKGFKKSLHRLIDHCLKMKWFRAKTKHDAEMERRVLHHIADRVLAFEEGVEEQRVEEQAEIEEQRGVEGQREVEGHRGV